jgi:uncharacterized membrane protein YgdD (TMEM256/DUF423 family)
MMPERPASSTLLVTACLLMAAGVGLGAFGAHGLRTRLSPDLLAIYETGVHYHLVHGLGACVAALLARSGLGRRAETGGWLFVAGIVLFSGSLYVLALTGTRWLGAITPFGGVAWIIGWVTLGWSAWHHARSISR